MPRTAKQLRLLPDNAMPGSPLPPKGTAFLAALLPSGWERYFNGRKAGRGWGLSIVCPHCHIVPPSELSGYRKWRWISVHLAEHGA